MSSRCYGSGWFIAFAFRWSIYFTPCSSWCLDVLTRFPCGDFFQIQRRPGFLGEICLDNWQGNLSRFLVSGLAPELEALGISACHKHGTCGKRNVWYRNIEYHTHYYNLIIYTIFILYTVLYTILCYAILYCTILYYTVLYYTMLSYNIPFCTIPYHAILYFSRLHYDTM